MDTALGNKSQVTHLYNQLNYTFRIFAIAFSFARFVTAAIVLTVENQAIFTKCEF
jgi:hypothetical protein